MNGDLITTNTISGSNGTDVYPTFEMPQVIAIVTAYDSIGNSFALPKFIVDVEPTGYTAINDGPDCVIEGDSINATVNQVFGGVVATFTSTDSATDISAYTATIDWGDANTAPGTIIPLGGDLYEVSGSHIYTMPDVAPLLIQVDNGSGDPATGLGSATITDVLTIAKPATATLEDDNVTVDLNALGQDAAGADQLTYFWNVSSSSGALVTFDDNNDNEAQNTVATLSAAGTYYFTATITNSSGQSVTSQNSVLVSQVQSSVTLSAPFSTVAAGSTLQFAATALDQFGIPMTTQPEFTWTSTYGTVSQSGLYTAPAVDEYTTISASIENLNGSLTRLSASEYIAITSTIQFAVTVISPTEMDLTVPPVAGPDASSSIEVLEVKGDYPNSGWMDSANFNEEVLISNGINYSPDIKLSPVYPTATMFFRIATFDTNTGVVTYSSTISATASSGTPIYNIPLVGLNGEVYPTAIAAIPSLNGSSRFVTLMWADTSPAEHGFTIERSTNNGSTFSVIGNVSADAQTYVDINPPQGVSLTYVVSPYNGSDPLIYNPDGDDPAHYGVALGQPIVFPNSPQRLVAQADDTNSTVDLSWTDQDPTTSSSGFEIQWSNNGTTFYTVGTVPAVSGQTTYSYVDDSPTANATQTNYYRIVAYNDTETDESHQLESSPSNVATASIIAAPIAVDDTAAIASASNSAAPYVTPVGKALTVNASSGVLANDYDPQGLTLTVDSYTQPSHGSVTVNNDGSFTYTPNANFSGTDSFTYIDTNGTVQSESAEVDIHVANQPVVTQPDNFHVVFNGSITEPAAALAANDSNPNNSTLTYSLSPDSAGNTTTQHGTLLFHSDGSFTYFAFEGYVGLDHFRYIVNDGAQDSNASTVVISVGSAIYTPPVVTTAPMAIPSQVDILPNGLQALWDSWQASTNRLAEAKHAETVLDQDAAVLQSMTPHSAGTSAAVNKVMADLTLMGQAFDNYLTQCQATATLRESYEDSEIYLDLDDAVVISAINSLPIGEAELNRYLGAPTIPISPDTAAAIATLTTQAKIWQEDGLPLASKFLSIYAGGTSKYYSLSSVESNVLKQELVHNTYYDDQKQTLVITSGINIPVGVWTKISGTLSLNYTDTKESDLADAFGSLDLAYSGTILKESNGTFVYDLTFSFWKHYNFTLNSPEHYAGWIFNSAFNAATYLENVGWTQPLNIHGSFIDSGFTT